MLATLLALLPKVGSVVAALPEFAALVESVIDTLDADDQATLKDAYALAIQQSDRAHAELQALVASRV